MIYQIIVTKYKPTQSGLILQNNWIEDGLHKQDVVDVLLDKYGMDLRDLQFPQTKKLSPLFEGEKKGFIYHIRVL